jgi:glutamate synthase (NADPH/NADH) large chain
MVAHDKKGLYVPQLEKDSCGTGLIANLNGITSFQLVSDALTMLENMEHRGACGCEVNTGDGAGIHTHIPHQVFMDSCDFDLPAKGDYGVAMLFVPKAEDEQQKCKDVIATCAAYLEFEVLGYRVVPVDPSDLGATALSAEPFVQQAFFKYTKDVDNKTLDRKLYILRRYITSEIHKLGEHFEEHFYINSLSCDTIVYKGQLTSHQVRGYYLDLQNPTFESAIALVHSRFSTNTVPKWKLAQPFRCISHNGEINTVQGNINWWKAREPFLKSNLFTEKELDIIFPICNNEDSDSSNFDGVLEFLLHAGRSIPHVLMMMIPEAYQNDVNAEQYKKDFYEYHEALMEPWDGPASICFTDGTLVGATLDRNGLRPSRYMLTDDNVLILASETGVIPVDPAKVILKDRLEPGKILVADLDEHRIIGDDELKDLICKRQPYADWLQQSKTEFNNIEVKDIPNHTPNVELVQQQIAYGFTKEDEEVLLQAMSENAKEPIGSMGSDTPIAVLSRYAQHLASYFKQQFAQVTNPPIDSLREKAFMTLNTYLGGCKDILDQETNSVNFIRLDSPLLSRNDFGRLIDLDIDGFKSKTLQSLVSTDYVEGDIKNAIHQLCADAESAINEGNNILIISNRAISEEKAPIPSLLSVGAVHHHLIKTGQRKSVSLVIDGGDIIETHHFATLISYGADAIFPGVSYDTIENLTENDPATSIKNYRYAVEKGLLKVMSKLGVSTVLSYKGAQTFEALGIGDEVIDVCFKGTVSRIQGMTFDDLAKETLVKHKLAFEDSFHSTYLQDLGIYQWKRRGEYHLFNPTSIHLLQNSTAKGDYGTFKKYTEAINKQDKQACTLRSLFDFVPGNSIPIEEVESAESIMKRFATGAMSFGSISYEAHSTLAIAMNRIGAKSNSGEGGEDESRYPKKENGDWERSAIKQVASGRFGVTINYLTNADELQIKMAQGAKPGEGGQLPGHKVNDWIARVRNSTPGVGLISPPPHHDIYSIEDLAQLIFDLKNANQDARISVKLVSKAGVGIIASGVTKGHADHILISGHDGGTGASPLSSIRHAGLPWELGLSETHQTLILNKLRDRVTIQADGQMRTGKDMAIATLLGAEEWGIATGALVVEGCILMRKCHLNTCPVGIATQREELREKFEGKVEHVVNFFKFLAEDMREIMARLGFRSINEMVGQADRLKIREDLNHWKMKNLDLSTILYKDALSSEQANYKIQAQDHGLENVLDKHLIELAELAVKDKSVVTSELIIKNTDRAVGAMLSNQVAKNYGSKGLPTDSIAFRFKGSAGQSFGAFGAKGLSFTLEGDTNDYFGKGLSGARLIVVPDRRSILKPEENIIVGNVALYGATSGEAYIKGKAGERFCVRNSGVSAVVEGLGAHGCEYMTGGRVIVLGEIGRNFAAGMSGGIAYLYDTNNTAAINCNKEMVDLDELDKVDFQTIRTLLRNHFRFTGSLKALDVLQHWDTHKKAFVKIMPTEYKAILEKQKQKVTAA